MSLRVAVAPTPVQSWVHDAVIAGGGVIVEPPEAEVLVWLDPRAPENIVPALAEAPNATFVQLPWAGVEPYVAAGVLDASRIWSCGKGVYAGPVAELALGMALAGLRGLTDYLNATSWSEPKGTTLVGGRATVLGAGGITESLVPMLTAIGADVTVVRRLPDPFPGAARTVGLDALHDAVADADAVFLALALTPATRGIFDAAAFQAMQPHAWFINVARGAHVITDDLVQALREGWIGGAGLDVTDPEPLPDGHPLWSFPNCIIAPHTGTTDEMADPLLAARITQNLARYAAAEPLLGLVDLDAGY